MKTLRAVMVICTLGVLAFGAFSMSPDEAEASTSISAAFVTQAGESIPGLIPPRVVVDMGNTVPLSTNWKYLGTFNGTEFATRATAAGGLIDAGFASTAGLVFTLDMPTGINSGASSAQTLVETEDVLIKVTKFTFGAPDAGSSTMVLDVGRVLDAGVGAPTLQRYMAGVNMLASAITDSAKPRTLPVLYNPDAGAAPTRLMEQHPHSLRLTFTQSAKSLITVNGGSVDVYIKAGALQLK
jgi:hypothetical protein